MLYLFITFLYYLFKNLGHHWPRQSNIIQLEGLRAELQPFYPFIEYFDLIAKRPCFLHQSHALSLFLLAVTEILLEYAQQRLHQQLDVLLALRELIPSLIPFQHILGLLQLSIVYHYGETQAIKSFDVAHVAGIS